MIGKIAGVIGFCIAATILLAPSACAQVCGDANGDGMATIGDIIYDMNYIYAGGPAPLNFATADFDRHLNLTISDMSNMLSTALGCDFFVPMCPPDLAALVPPLDTTFKVTYDYVFRANRSHEEIDLALITPTGSRTLGMSLPIRIRVEGQVPVIDSVLFPLPASKFMTGPSFDFILADSGMVALGGLTFPNFMSTHDNFAKVFISMPSSSAGRRITVDWTKLTPVQASTQDSSIIPMVSGYCGDASKTPKLVTTCCRVPGDANDDGIVNISDAVYMLLYIFSWPGRSPLCLGQWDTNGSNAVDISDVVFLISYIFAGGPAPRCAGI